MAVLRWAPHAPGEQRSAWARGFVLDLAMLKPDLRLVMVRLSLRAVVISWWMGAEDVGCVLGSGLRAIAESWCCDLRDAAGATRRVFTLHAGFF